MTPHQRILATLNRQPVDRIPVDLWLTPEALRSMKAHTGMEDELEMYRALEVDKIVWINPDYRVPGNPEGQARNTLWGAPLVEVQSGEATYSEIASAPLADMEEPEELDDYPGWPDPDAFDNGPARAAAERARSFGLATIGPWISHFEIYCQMRGLENALMDLIDNTEFLEAALERIDSIQTTMLERFLDDLGDLCDIVFVSDDLGTQESQLMSVDQWSTHLKPRLRRWCEIIRSRGKCVLFHTDGAARPFIPHFIECGVQILNPIQHVCPGMERAALKRDFGRDLVFYGGVENQQVIPRGTPDDVRQEVNTCLDTLGKEGGYIPCSCHYIQAGTPVANILAIVETVHRFSRG